MPRARGAHPLTVVFFMLVSACTGEGCDCLADLQGEFPLAARQPAGLQVRLTESGLAVLSENAFSLLEPRLGDDLEFPVPADCASDPSVCCGYPAGYCRMRFDLEDYGEGSHIEVEALDQSGNRLGITLWPRVRTVVPMPARTYGPLGGAIDCNVEFNTGWSGAPWMTVYFEVILGEDEETGEMRARVTTAQISGLSTGDISIWGDFLCRFGSEQDAINGIASGFRNQVPRAIEDMLCQTCDASAGCGDGATCDDGVCVSSSSGQCRQSLGLSGQHQAGELLGSLLGQAMAKKLDVYMAAGAGAIAEDDGLTLPITSGTEPAATPADHHCVPVVAAPTAGSMTLASGLRGNTHPVTQETYDLGAAFHVDALNRAAWAAHQAGYICLNLGTRRVEMLDSASMLLVVPSLGTILEERDNQPMHVLLRPQQAPVIGLGAGTFTEGPGGVRQIDEALIDVGLADLELDFYAFVDGRYARLFTVVADANLGVSLDVDGDGGLLPVLDDPASALSNIRVTNVSLVAEAAAEIADRIPAILGVALGNLSSQLGDAIALPELAGIALELEDGAFTSLENNTRLALFANLALGAATERRPVDTHIESVELDRAAGAVALAVSSTAGAATEWQFRFGDGFWSPFSTRTSVRIERAQLRVGDRHSLQVRARRRGEPRSLDPSPATLAVLDLSGGDGPNDDPIAFHGSSDASGCECDSGNASGSGLFLMLVALLLAFGRRHARRLAGPAALALILAVSSGCSCDGSSGESDPDDPDQLQPGPIGRWIAVASDGDRLVVAGYERSRGDLVVGEMREVGEPRVRAVAGVPEGPVSRDPDGYRGGIDAAGPDVGAWVSARMRSGKVLVAYQDRDRRGLVVARESGDRYDAVDVDIPPASADTLEVGRYASLAVGPDGTLGVSYLAVSIDTTPATDQTPEVATVNTELRYASATSPEGPWTVELVATAQADHASRVDVPAGVGLWSALVLTEAGPAIAHYDSVAGDLVLATRTTQGWAETILDGAGADRGQHIAMLADGPRVLIAYQDATDDRLLLRALEGGNLGPVEVVDDGVRDGDRNHPVGASAAISIAGDQLGIAYQDAASGQLLLSTRAREGGTWTTRAAALEGAAGFGVGLGADGDTFWAASSLYLEGRGSLHVVAFDD